MSDIAIDGNRTRARVSLRERSFQRLCSGQHNPLGSRNGGNIPLVELGSDTWCQIVSIEWYRRLCRSSMMFFFSMRTTGVNSKVRNCSLLGRVVVWEEERRRRTLTFSRHMVGRI